MILYDFFTSDQHYGHEGARVKCNRPFGSIEHMNEELIRRFNEVVQPHHRVAHLGDFTLGKSWVPAILPRLNGIHDLYMGNHDWVHPIYSQPHQSKSHPNRKPKARVKNPKLIWDMYTQAGFQTMQLEGFTEIAGQKVRLSHIPYTNHDGRYPDWRPKDDGLWLLHGHTHKTWKIRGREINVGVDVWDYAPVPVAEFEKIIRGGL
jgi:calcineurin-like phosphoesterase family protein